MSAPDDGLSVRIVQAELVPFGGALERSSSVENVGAAGNARQRWTRRHGVILVLRDDDGRVGIGEASPLPGFSRETLEQCRDELAVFTPRWPGLGAITIEAATAICAGLSSPAARFAVATALLDLLAQEAGVPMWRVLDHDAASDAPVAAIPCNGLVSELEHALEQVEQARTRGLETVKLKIGRPGRFAEELAVLQAIRKTHGDGIALRLDANQAWSAAEAGERLAALRAIAPEYVEEPTDDWSGLIALGRPPVPLALDESLSGLGDALGPDRGISELVERAHLRALIIKPMLLGFFEGLDWAARARARSIDAVVSHLFGGPVELAACIQLAAAARIDSPCGLAPHAGLSAWPSIESSWLAPDRVGVPRGPGLAIAWTALRDGRDSSHAGLDAALEPAAIDRALSIHAAAEEAPGRIGLIVVNGPGDSRSYRFTDLARASQGVRRTSAPESQSQSASVLAIAAPRHLDTIAAIHAALHDRVPVALLHSRATRDESTRMVALTRDPRAHHRDVAAVLFTSGSSARPKGVLLPRRAFTTSAAASAYRLGWRDDDRWLCCLPLAHIGGLSILTRCLVARRCAVVVAESSFDPAVIIPAITEHRVTLLSLVPTMLERLLDAGWSPPGHLRAVLLGGAAARRALLESAFERGVPALVTYGMTEACSQICTQVPGTGVQEAGHIGPPLPGFDLAIRDGRIAVRGPSLFLGYLGDETRGDETRGGEPGPHASSSAWIDTGDRGRIDARGDLHVLGRADDTIITGGENVHPAEIESVLERHPAIAAACVFGVPDPTWGELVACALVVRPSGLQRHELADFLSSALPGHKRPRLYCVIAQFALGPTGKLDRRATAERARPALQPLEPR